MIVCIDTSAPISRPSEPSGAPDLARAIIGYRVWRLHNEELYAPHQGDRWLPVTHSWPCSAGEEVHHPGPSCPCGLYAYYDPVGALQELMHFFWRENSGDYLIGGIAAWGKVLTHEHGLRASSARIVALSHLLVTDRQQLAACGAAYGVPVLSYQLLAPEVLKYGGGVADSLLPQSYESNVH